MLIITVSHQTFFNQFWYFSGENKFDLTHLLYIINGKVSVFLEDKVMSGQISTLIISTDNIQYTGMETPRGDTVKRFYVMNIQNWGHLYKAFHYSSKAVEDATGDYKQEKWKAE